MGVQTSLTSRDSCTISAAASPQGGWPIVPSTVAMLIRDGIVSAKMVFPEKGPAREDVVWRPPVVTDPVLRLELERHLTEVEAYLEPMSRGELLARILALLSHYRLDPQPEAIEEMIADDWAEDLGDYPRWAVEAAARRWRRQRKFKPQICEMIELCESECGDKLVHRDRMRAIVDVACLQSSAVGGRVQAAIMKAVQRIPIERHD